MFDDLSNEIDDYYPEYEDRPPTQKQLDHARSLIGKFCKSNGGNTPLLKNLLCKVIAVNDYRRGGNPSQVKMMAYRNNQRWGFKYWWHIGSETKRYEVIGSGWLTETTERPTIKDYILGEISRNLRIIISNLSSEHTAFHYKWWKHDGMWQYLPPIANLVSAFNDFGNAFKYGCYLKN